MLNKILAQYPLTPHPEGGAYLESYRSTTQMGDRNISTAIYFLLLSHEFSSFHRIKSDEIWHFYLGGPLEIIEIAPDGTQSVTILGNEVDKGQRLQYVVKAGHWFGSRPLKNSLFSFVGCTVSPGFDFRDFELADYETLTQEYPQHTALIQSLTHKKS